MIFHQHDFPSTCHIVNKNIKLDKENIESIYSKTCHIVGIVFIQYLINKKKIDKVPEIKIHESKLYSYSDLMKIPDELYYEEIHNYININNIPNGSQRDVYINKIIENKDIDEKIREDLSTIRTRENKNNKKALNFIKTPNTISRIQINRSDFHEFVIININNKLYLLQTNMYNLKAHNISKIELTIEDIINIFNNNINEELSTKINFKIYQFDGFFINAFYGYKLKI